MSNFRITTNGLYRTYRTNLNKNNSKLSDAMLGLETQRKFNTYAEDPAAASKAWRLRRSYWHTGDQIDNTNYVISKYESAYTAMGSIIDGDVGNGEYGLGLDAIMSAVRATSDGSGSSRTALGKELLQTADNIVSMMNSKYGDEFIFAGADGANIPFSWSGDKLLYRGVDVTTPETSHTSAEFKGEDGLLDKTTDAYRAAEEAYVREHPGYSFEDALKLKDYANEATYVDIGLGMQEQEGALVEGSAFNSAVSGLTFLGYGEDKNLVMIIRELGEIYSRADEDTGTLQNGDDPRAEELLNRLHDAVRSAQDQHTQLTADAKYLKTNLKQLETNKSELDRQIVDTEDLDMAEAITSMTWAQYCYNAALRIGTNILSQSLIDYMS